MSLWWNRRTIARAVAGDLAPPAEARLRHHLRGCSACRQHYDLLTGIAASAAAGPSELAARRQRALLTAALEAGPATKPAASRRRWQLLLPLGLAPALGVAALLLVRHRPPALEPEVAERGEAAGSGTTAIDEVRASLALRLYARRRQPGKAAGPVRLVGELPGSGELRAAGDEELQLAYTNLKAPRHLVLMARTAEGKLRPIFPRGRPGDAPATAPALLPTEAPRLLGEAFGLGSATASERLELVAVVSRTALAREQIENVLRDPQGPPARATGATTFAGVLWIDQ
jgi:hypothetical protein